MDTWFILSLPLGLVAVVGLWLVLYGVRERQKAQAAAQWPDTEGKGLSVKIDRHSSRSKYGTNVWYVPQLEYEYLVGGVRYTSRRIAFGSLSFKSEAEARSFLQAQFEGRPLPVHYDPRQPKNAVLLTGAAPHMFAFMLAGGVITTFALLLGIYFLFLS